MQPETTERIVAAAARFEEKVKDAPLAPPPSRRERYLSRNLSRTKATLLATEAVAAGATAPPAVSVAEISHERIVGTSDLVDINYLELAIAVGRGVARIQIAGAHGTGFLVGPGLIMTNNHVLENEEDAIRAIAQFDYQDNASGELLPRQDYRLNPGQFFMTDKTLDFTIVGVESVSQRGRALSRYPWLRLIAQLGKTGKGEDVNIIQHPRGGLKQIAFRRNEVIEIPDGQADFLYYTTDTEPGSSGSPCFNDQWELVALHHAGVPKRSPEKQILRVDGQPWRKGIDPDGLIHWIGNEGARISAIVAALRDAELKPQWQELRSQILDSTAPNPIELARTHVTNLNGSGASSVVVGTNTSPGVEMGQSHTWTIPVHFTVTIGGIGTVAPTIKAESSTVEAPPTPTEDLGPEVTIDQDWSKRVGYDPEFLGTNIPLPELSDEMKEDTVEVPPQFQSNGREHILNYYHYSVAMNKKRRCAWFSAAMIDGDNFQDFKRGKDKWFLDPRIDSKFQMGEELYAEKNTDRGHLTRFKDLSWGATKDDAVKATNDSFHFTNCSLQLDLFNQGKERWQGLELFLLEKFARENRRRMVVFTGPVLKDSDPKYKNKFMDYTARIPLAFWKVCVLRRKSDDSISATAFTLNQEDVTDLPGFEEKFDVTTTQITLADLENLTGLDFGVLTDNDHFASSGPDGTLEIAGARGEVRKVKPIEEYDDIVV